MPKWSTPERQTVLVRLWTLYGNKCLYGHSTCPNPLHYLDFRPKVVAVPKPVVWPCQDRNGNPIRDRDGNQLYLTLYKTAKGVVYEIGFARLYDRVSSELIAHWKAEDREARAHSRKLISRTLHSLNERGSLRGTFNAISRTIYHDSQPQFYFEALGVSALTFRPFAKVRLASSSMRLHVDLGDTLKGIGKNKRRKAIRYSKALPVPIQREVDSLCAKAVRDYLG